jgi:two-component system cell cycle response regulator DivK
MSARILIIEDNPPNRALMAYLLRAFGHAVLTADDGEEGAAIAGRERPDLILMDLQMPNVNGTEARRRIRTLDALNGVPIIAVTAFAMVGDRERLLAEGFDGYLSKPINPETFVGEIEAFLPAQLRASSGKTRRS